MVNRAFPKAEHGQKLVGWFKFLWGQFLESVCYFATIPPNSFTFENVSIPKRSCNKTESGAQMLN